MKKYLYIFKYHQEDELLFKLEQKYLFQRNTSERYFFEDSLQPMEETCFGEVILEISAHESNFEQFKESLKELPVLHDAKLDSLSIGLQPHASFNHIIKLLPSLYIHANLVDPSNLYLLTRIEQDWYLGRVASKAQKAWNEHRQKPESVSIALPHKMARTIVLVLKSMGHKTLIDFGCGSGTILVEAASINLSCTGIDLNPNMIEISRKNLDHFGYKSELIVADASTFTQQADCAVVDFPYGYHCQRDPEVEERIIDNVMTHVKTAVFICGDDFSSKFLQRQLVIKEMISIPSVNITRYIYFIEHD
jgi:predicted RNA methylase